MSDLIQLVRDALKNAAENGYEFHGVSDEDTATDMCNYDSDLEHYEVEEVAAAVHSIRKARFASANIRRWHRLKTDPVPYVLVEQGLKTHEVRFDDRLFKVGDGIVLMKTRFTAIEMHNGAPLEFTGDEIEFIITHVLSGYGLHEGWVVLSIHKHIN